LRQEGGGLMPWKYTIQAKCKNGRSKTAEEVYDLFKGLSYLQMSGRFDDDNGTFTLELISNDGGLNLNFDSKFSNVGSLTKVAV
jgi:hypothetical protein